MISAKTSGRNFLIISVSKKRKVISIPGNLLAFQTDYVIVTTKDENIVVTPITTKELRQLIGPGPLPETISSWYRKKHSRIGTMGRPLKNKNPKDAGSVGA